MTTLIDAKATYQQAVARQSQLDAMLDAHLEAEGFYRERTIDQEEDLNRLCQLVENFLPDEFSAARRAYRAAADQLEACALEWLKVNGATPEQIETFAYVMELPYREQELIEMILKLPC